MQAGLESRADTLNLQLPGEFWLADKEPALQQAIGIPEPVVMTALRGTVQAVTAPGLRGVQSPQSPTKWRQACCLAPNLCQEVCRRWTRNSGP